MVVMSAALRDRFRRGSAEAEPEPFSDGGVPGEGDAGEWLAYELHAWALESRVMLQQLLTVDKVVHSWQGTTLMVHESLEEKVDSLVDEVEEAEKAQEATARPIGPEDPLTAFELAEWPEALRAELLERLEQARVPYILDTEGDTAGDEVFEGEAGGRVSGLGDVGVGDAATGDAATGDVFEGDVSGRVSGLGDVGVGDAATGDAGVGGTDEGDAGVGKAIGNEVAFGGDSADDAESGEVFDLLVREADEERVELLIDDLLAREEEADFEELDGLEVNDLLSDLFVACDRLRRDPGDLDGMRGVVTNARRIAGVRTPFGFSATNWRTLRHSVGELLDLVESDDTDTDDLREFAHRMSDTLRMLV